MLTDRVRARTTMLIPDSGVRFYGRFQARIFQLSSGRLGGRFGQGPVLLITTTGRRSGQQRTTPVLYVLDGTRYVVIGSNTGSDSPPAWALNLLANPNATIQIRNDQKSVRARVLEGEEKRELWKRMNDQYKGFDMYRERTDRDIKTFLLEPR